MEKAIVIKDFNINQLEYLLQYLINRRYKWREKELETIGDIIYFGNDKVEVLYLDYTLHLLRYSSVKYLREHLPQYEVITLNDLPMRKSDLKPGMVVEYANGERRLVVTINNDLYLISRASFADVKSFNDDLTCDSDPKINIVKVFQPKEAASLSSLLDCSNCIWERPKEIVLTMQEIADKFGIPVEQLKIKK
jgi:hypothetical protein